ncbi:hypothetical protein AVEN_136448-1, partial [Araneus ventricosus]
VPVIEQTTTVDFEESFNRFVQFLGGIWNPEMNGLLGYKPKFGLERLFLAWFPANLFARRSLANVESLHDYTLAPYPGEIPYHDVEDKMSGSIHMLCFWINVNFLYRSGYRFLLFVKSVMNYIKNRGEEPSSAQTRGPSVSLVAKSEGQVLPPEDPQVNPTAEQGRKLSEPDSSVKVPKEECTSSKVQDDGSLVSVSGCIAC